jgi:hypothetical protein
MTVIDDANIEMFDCTLLKRKLSMKTKEEKKCVYASFYSKTPVKKTGRLQQALTADTCLIRVSNF